MTVCVACYSSNAFFRTSSPDAAAFCFFWQVGGAIYTGGTLVITESEFEGNTAPDGNNIYHDEYSGGDVTCNDANTFESPAGNVPEKLCDADCDVNTFAELQGAIDRDGDIKLCRGTIAFTEQIFLNDKRLTFTCPHGGCVLDAELKSRFFQIGGSSNISFDGITFKNGKKRVSPQ